MNEQLAFDIAEVGLDVPQGYKRTEVGVIPEDWDLLSIDDVATFSGGAQPPRSTFISSPKAGYIRLIQIRDYKTSQYETYIPEQFARKTCSSTEIMIGRYGPPIFQILRGITGAYNVALIKASPKKNIQQEFLYYILKSEKLFELMEMLSQRSSGQTGVELPALRSYPIALPPLAEQTAIATALSDVDALINELEQLIAKKQAIKTATMQQLLTGRTRLPQFALRDDGSPKGYKASELGEIPEDWDLSDIGSHTTWLSGGTPNRNNLSFWSGTVPWISGSTLKSFEISTSDQCITEDAIVAGSKKANVGFVLLLVRGSALHNEIRAGLVVTPVAFNQDVKALVPNKNIDPKYLTFFLLGMEADLLKLVSSAGNSAGVLDTELVKGFKFFLPSTVEQTAIATTLSDMDSDISNLQQRLSKTRQIKQGMMQELLTGKTRLIPPPDQVQQ